MTVESPQEYGKSVTSPGPFSLSYSSCIGTSITLPNFIRGLGFLTINTRRRHSYAIASGIRSRTAYSAGPTPASVAITTPISAITPLTIHGT
jgi:hypothetical protein